jgi:hypothetical protein
MSPRTAGVVCLFLVALGASACSTSGNGPDSESASQPPWAWLKLSLIETYAFTDFRYFTSCEASEEPLPGFEEPPRWGAYYLQTWIVSCDTPEGRATLRVHGSTLDMERGTAGSVQPVQGDVAALRVDHWYGCRGSAAAAAACTLLGEVVRVEPNPNPSWGEGLVFPSRLTVKSRFDGSVEVYVSADPPETWEVGMPFYER